MPRPAEQTTRWVADKISKMPEVRRVELTGPNTFRITRDKYDAFTAGIIAVPLVLPAIVEPLLDSDPTIEILVNVPKESA
jgi:hypothetical protein